MEEMVRNREADFICLSRPLIREPDIIGRWEKGQGDAPSCVSCNLCFEALLQGKPLHCAYAPSIGNNRSRSDTM